MSRWDIHSVVSMSLPTATIPLTGPPVNSLPTIRTPSTALLPMIKALEARNRWRIFPFERPRLPPFSASRIRPFKFMALPAEIRERIYEHIWEIDRDYYFSIYICFPSLNIRRLHDHGCNGRRGSALLLVSRQVCIEAAHVLYSLTTLRIDSFPYKRAPDTLSLIGSRRTQCFTSTTRNLCIRSSFGVLEAQNEAWLKVLRSFHRLTSLQVLLDMEGWLSVNALKDVVANLIPFTTLGCKAVTFRGPDFVPVEYRKEVENVWEDTVASRTDKGPVV